MIFLFEEYCDHQDLHVLTHSFPTRRSSDLKRIRISGSSPTPTTDRDGPIEQALSDTSRPVSVETDSKISGSRISERMRKRRTSSSDSKVDRKSTRLNSSH